MAKTPAERQRAYRQRLVIEQYESLPRAGKGLFPAPARRRLVYADAVER